jgi:autotransporter-associated beta strand protein
VIATTQADGISLDVTLGPVTIAGGSLALPVDGSVANLHFAGAIGETSTASITKTGDGVANFNANNSYSGQTIVNEGYLGVAANLALGTGTNTAADGTVVNAGGTLTLRGTAQIANERVVLTGGGQSGNGAFQTQSGAGATSWGGDIVLNTTGIAMNLLGASLTISGKITGSGDFQVGRSPVTITNPLNDYAGQTVIGNPSGGSTTLVLGADGVIPDASAVSILAGATVDLNGRNETVGSLGGVGTLNVNGGTLTTGGSNASTTFDGGITGTGQVNKVGTGTFTLAGNSAAYTGQLNVTTGAVALTGSLGGTIQVTTGGTLSGTGTAGAVIVPVAQNGVIAPGGASTGVLTATGLTLAGGTLNVRLNGVTAGAQYDQMSVANATLGGTLAVTLGFAPSVGNVFRIVDVTGANPVTGTFAGLPEGTVFSVGATPLQISYVGGTGNDVTLTVVPAGPGAPSIVTTSPLPNGQVGAGYSTTIVGGGGTPPYAWSVTAGALPAGLSLNSATGLLSGTPTASGAFNFTVTLTDNAAQTANKPFALTIAPAGLAVTTSSLLGGTVGTPYAGTLAASGGTPPYTWSITSGALPPGVTLNPATGALTGSPTAPGTFSFTATVTDGVAGTASAPLSIVVAAAGATQPIPALGPWMLGLLAMLTALGGLVATRRR